MEQTLLDFVQVVRAAGVRVSAAEAIDALRAAEVVGPSDRTTLEDALGAALAKSRDERALFEACFALYFGRGASAAPDVPDRAAVALAIERAGRRIGARGIRFALQTNMIVQQMLRELDPALRVRDDVRADVRAYVERALALAAPGERRWRDDNLRTVPLWRLDRRDVERMRVVVRALAKRLATRYGRDRRRRRRGRLDVRRTLRRNAVHDGIPFVTSWKRRTLEKPRIVVLCDVSGSVAPVAQFLLLFVHSVADALAGVRSFAFSDRLVDIGPTLATQPVETAIAEIVTRIGLRSTDYGQALDDFANAFLHTVDRRTSVIVMGDARSNDSDPRTAIFKTIARRAKRVIWLNPEPRAGWGSGDSEMLAYLPYCDLARECSTVRDLERTVAGLLARR